MDHPDPGDRQQITKLGPFPFQVGIGGGPYVAHPTGGPDWKLRMTFAVILPKGR